MLTYLISDLHLAPEHKSGTALFQQFMNTLAPKADALYVLGDLFEAWVGDDDDDRYVQNIIDRFQQFSTTGKPLYFQRGNRDFLLGDAFTKRTGGQMLDDEHITELANQTVLLMHGDQLCVDDVDYQKFRAMVRTEAWQQTLLAKPLTERKAIASAMRMKSKENQQNKAEYIMDVNQAALESTLQKHQVSNVIHGHTHRPAHHQFTLNEQAAHRWVLGDWHDSAKIIECRDTIELISIQLDRPV